MQHYYEIYIVVLLPTLEASAKNKDHAGDEEFRGRRSIQLEQFISCPANRNSAILNF